jgi:hypothetical protein
VRGERSATTTTSTVQTVAAFASREPSTTGSQPAARIGVARPTVRTVNRSMAISENTTPRPTIRVPRQPPSNTTPVSTTPAVASAAPSAWSSVSDSFRIRTAATTVSPPYAATTGLTTASGPIRRAVKNDRYAPAATAPKKSDAARAPGSDGSPLPWTMARITTTSRLAAWAIATTGRLPSRRPPIVASTSVEPQHSAAISP